MRPAAAEEEIAPELAVLRHEPGVVGSVDDAAQTLVGRELLERGIAAEVEREAAERATVILDVPRPQLCVGERRGAVDRLGRAGAEVLVAKVRADGDQDGRSIGLREDDVVAGGGQATALRHDPQPRLECGAERAAPPAHDEVAVDDVGAPVELAVQVGAELERRRSLDAQHEHVVRSAREVLAAHTVAVQGVGDRDDPGLQVELAPVVLDVLLVLAAEEKRRVRELLVRGLAVRQPEHRQLRQRVRLLGAAREEQRANLVEVRPGVGVRPVGEPRPERLLVELDRLLVDPPEDHAAQAPVPDRGGAEPAGGRRAPPESGGIHLRGKNI